MLSPCSSRQLSTDKQWVDYHSLQGTRGMLMFGHQTDESIINIKPSSQATSLTAVEVSRNGTWIWIQMEELVYIWVHLSSLETIFCCEHHTGYQCYSLVDDFQISITLGERVASLRVVPSPQFSFILDMCLAFMWELKGTVLVTLIIGPLHC